MADNSRFPSVIFSSLHVHNRRLHHTFKTYIQVNVETLRYNLRNPDFRISRFKPVTYGKHFN